MTSDTPSISEVDEAGSHLATYALSPSSKPNEDRVDIIQPSNAKQSLWQTTLDVFLPVGFPHSVTNDYVEYQIYDSLQAFASSIAGLLSSRAVLASLGVGDATSSATAAVIFKVVQESLGRLATIAFAYRYGTVIEPECKMYRLLADVLNDFAFVLDCLSPMLPSWLSVLALSSSGVLRALCGVAAGSAKASLSAHFARWGNLGELNAKDSSQETIISLLGMLFGTVVVSYVNTPSTTWFALILLLALHLEMNRRAVRAVTLLTLNRQRARLMYHSLRRGTVPKPEVIAAQEQIFEIGGPLKLADGRIIGYCTIGSSIEEYLQSGTRTSSGATVLNKGALLSLLKSFEKRPYVMWYDLDSVGSKVRVSIALKEGVRGRDKLLAWWHAQALAEDIHRQRSGVDLTEEDAKLSSVERAGLAASKLLTDYGAQLEKAGWDLDSSAVETRSGPRLRV